MKNLLVVLAVLVGSVFAVNAQTATTSQTANEGFVGYSFMKENATFDRGLIRYDADNDSHGFNVAYTRYFGGTATKAGVVGVTGDFGAQFNNGENSMVTGLVGVTAKARNYKYVQPYVRALGGVARQHVHIHTLTDVSDYSAAFAVGTGLDINTKAYSRYKIRLGVDYLNTGFGGERQNNVRFTTGLVF